MYIDNQGIEHRSYNDACRYYGLETPEQAELDYQYEVREAREAQMDQMMALGGPVPFSVVPDLMDEIPF